MIHKRVDIRILERVIQVFIMVFGVAALGIFIRAVMEPNPGYLYSMIVVVIELLLLLIVSLFVLLYISLKIWEQHIIPDETYRTKKTSATKKRKKK